MKFVPIIKNRSLFYLKFSWIIICILSLIQMSCQRNSSDNCTSTEQAFITKVDGSKTGTVNQNILFTVYFGVNNGCGKFGSVSENISGNTRTMSVYATYIGCLCTMVALEISTTYTFRASHAGIYYLKFLQANNTYITDTLTIQ